MRDNTPRVRRLFIRSSTTFGYSSFTLDGNGYDDNAPASDAAGNLTYAPGSKYTYDAWNRLVKVTKAYRDPSNGTVQANLVVSTSAYDGMGRRIVKTVQNSAYLDATYHYYYNPGGQSAIEVRDGSNLVLKQQVWGLTYIDELVQTSMNDDPADGTEDDCESHYWALQDANFNVLGVVDASGVLRERYEYTPYGERRVFTSPGVNDPLCYAPIDISKRWVVGSTAQAYGICEVGHQGLWHDEETGLVYNRARMLHTGLGRFLQRDPLGYVDGLNLCERVLSNPVSLLDPFGNVTINDPASVGLADNPASDFPYEPFPDDAYAATRCNYETGEPAVLTNPKEFDSLCDDAKQCITLHENVHVKQQSSCCAKAAKEWKACTKSANPQACRNQVRHRFVHWSRRNNDLFECEAHTQSVECLENVFSGKCKKQKGKVSPKDPNLSPEERRECQKCCNDLNRVGTTSENHRDRHCGKTKAGETATKCPFGD